MEFTNDSPSRKIIRTPLRGYSGLQGTPTRPRLPSQQAQGRSPSQGTASPQRTARVTSARYFPYGRKIQTPGEYERLQSRRRDYLKEWEVEQDLAEIEAMPDDDEEEDTDDDLAPRGYSSFSFSLHGEESPQVVYEKKWHVLVMAENAPEGSYNACITFADFPWPIDIVRLSPSSLPISPANFAIHRKHLHAFLYNSTRLSRRNMTFERLEEEEKFRWDLRVIDTRILVKVIPEDREAVRQAAAIVSANLYGLSDDDPFVTGAKVRLPAIRTVQYSQKKRGFDAFLRSLQKEERRQREREKEMARVEAAKYRTPVKSRERVQDNRRPPAFSDTMGLMGKVDLFGDYVD